MKNVNLEGSHMAGVNLRVATLKNANLQNCDLRGAVLAGADLEVGIDPLLVLTLSLVFTWLHYRSFENTAGKEEIARNKQFLLFQKCFLSFWRTFCHFHQIQICCLQTLSGWKILKFVIWERAELNLLPCNDDLVSLGKEPF